MEITWEAVWQTLVGEQIYFNLCAPKGLSISEASITHDVKAGTLDNYNT